MAEVSQVWFSFLEVAEALIKQQGIHSGHWAISVKFAIAGANVSGQDGKTRPTAVVPIMELGIQRFDEATDMTVNAADVNPPREPTGEYAHSKKEIG